jgi:hypothetical protein
MELWLVFSCQGSPSDAVLRALLVQAGATEIGSRNLVLVG